MLYEVITLGIPVNKMLYSVHDPEVALYRSFVDGPVNGEKPVYEELYHLATDPNELNNLVDEKKYRDVLEQLRKEWEAMIKEARGKGNPWVLRYTADSMMEKYGVVKNE